MFRTLLGDTALNSGVHYWELTVDDRTENELKIGVSITILLFRILILCMH